MSDLLNLFKMRRRMFGWGIFIMFLSFEVMIFFLSSDLCDRCSSLPYSFQHTTTLQSPLILVKLGLVIDIVIVSFLHFLCLRSSCGLIFASNKFFRLFLLSLLFFCGCTLSKNFKKVVQTTFSFVV